MLYLRAFNIYLFSIGGARDQEGHVHSLIEKQRSCAACTAPVSPKTSLPDPLPLSLVLCSGPIYFSYKAPPKFNKNLISPTQILAF